MDTVAPAIAGDGLLVAVTRPVRENRPDADGDVGEVVKAGLPVLQADSAVASATSNVTEPARQAIGPAFANLKPLSLTVTKKVREDVRFVRFVTAGRG
jgi:hypothetical protein